RFDRLRRDVLTTGSLEQLFLPIGDAQKTILIERANVTGLEPAVAGKHGPPFFRLVVVTAHHVWTTHFDLAVFGDADLNVRNCLADSSRTDLIDTAGRDHGRSFGQTVTLNDRNTRAKIDVSQLFSQRCAARYQEPHLSTKRALPL